MARNEADRVWADAWRAADRNGLSEEAGYLFAVLTLWSWEDRIPIPQIVSGRRSSTRQAKLRKCYDRDPRTARQRCGVVVRPSRRSRHTSGDAFDLADDGWLHARGAWTEWLGYRWGGNFRTPDPVHFDVR